MDQKEKTIYLDSLIVKLNAQNINDLKKDIISNKSSRGRICTHSDIDNSLHEMFIVSKKSKYVCPHKNQTKNKSFHVIEGLVDIVYFTETGRIRRIFHMGDYDSGIPFYVRLKKPGYHTLVTVSDILIVKETIDGPFKPSDTVYAPWAPDEKDPENGDKYLSYLRKAIAEYDNNNK